MTSPVVGRRLRLAYSLPAMVMALPTVPVYVLLPTFYVEHTALGFTAVGWLLGIARLLDLGSDLIVGRWCDQPIAGLGRRKGWILLGALILGPALWLLFTPQASSGAGRLLVSAAALYLGWTLVQIPYLAWSAELATGYQQRIRLNSNRELFGVVGLLISAALPAIGGTLGWQDPTTMRVLAACAIATGLCSFTWMLSAVPEPAAVKRPSTDRPLNAASWKALLHNKLWLRLLLVWTLNGTANGFAAVLFPVFVTTGLGLAQAYRGPFLFLYFAAAMAAMLLLPTLGQRFSKHRLWSLAMLMAAATFATVPWLPLGAQAGFTLVCLLTGLALAVDLAIPPALQADIVDWDRYRFDRDHPGLCFAGASLVTKLALGIAVVLAPLLISLLGWQEQGPWDDPVRFRVAMIYAWVPCVLKVMAVALMWNFPLDESRHQKIRQRLDRRPEWRT